MALNVLTPVIAFPTSGAVTAWGLPERESGSGFSGAGESEGPIGAASWAFSIWGVIYAGLVMFILY